MSYYLVLVGTVDNPLYEAYLTSAKASSSTTISITSPPPPVAPAGPSPTSFSIFGATASPGSRSASTSTVGYGHKTGPNGRHVMQLVAHASLDVVEDVQWTNGAMYLKSIDKFQDWSISVWLTPGGVKLILLHEVKNDEGIRLFFQETWENYVKTLLNPFHELNAPIRSTVFDHRIRASAKKHL